MGAAAVVGVALVAYRSGSLARSGVIGAALVGIPAAVAGVGWAALLITYFVATSAISRAGRAAKHARTDSVIEKGGARDLWQVLANGGVFGVAALCDVFTGAPSELWRIMATGALAASAADTFATEIGTWIGGTPRNVRTMAPVPPGTSGAVTIAGSAGMVIGAVVVVALAAILTAPVLRSAPNFAAVALAGVVGAMADTVLGAWAQSTRRCPQCDVATEQRVHRCGSATLPAGGVPWIGNDAVNAACTAVGALVAVSVVRP